jgi:hypothetical protein
MHVDTVFKCEECQFKTTIKSDFDAHLGNLFNCEKCTLVYHTDASLQTHIENEHKEEHL